MRKCKYCGFENPEDVGECLNCQKELPRTKKELQESWKTAKAALKGDWDKVAKKGIDDYVGDQKSAIKYKFHPVWILKVKFFRFKKTVKVIFIILVILFIFFLLSQIFK
jgi:hypothetical protein